MNCEFLCRCFCLYCIYYTYIYGGINNNMVVFSYISVLHINVEVDRKKKNDPLSMKWSGG